MHPIDCIKTLQQSNVALQLGLDTNFVKAATYLYTSYDDGILAFYHGFLTYAMSDAMGGALKFAVWELWKQQKPQQTSSNNNDHETTATLPQQIFTALYLLVGAALAFVASSVVIVPGELVKQQLQMNKYDGLVNALVGIYNSNNGGLLAFFAGYEGVLYRDIPYTMLELGLYELFKSIVVQVRYNDTKDDEHGPPQTLQAWEEVAAAAVTGGLTAFCTTPFDVIKTKLMVDSEYANYSFWQCLVETVDAHGWPSVFSGVIARIAWILPFTGTYHTDLDEERGLYSSNKDSHLFLVYLSTAIYLPTYDALKRVLLLRHIAYVEDQQQEAIKTRWQ